MKRAYPEHVMEVLRHHIDLDSDDTSQDDELRKIEPRDVFVILSTWELGHPGWGSAVEKMIEDVGGQIVWPK